MSGILKLPGASRLSSGELQFLRFGFTALPLAFVLSQWREGRMRGDMPKCNIKELYLPTS
jgi:hypothetical protein